MKINKEKLVELLVEKTGMETDEVTAQLDQLIQRIVDAAKRGKALEIKEFGLFYFDDEGDLKFEPSTEFSTEVNFKYAGMEPIELNPPRETPASAEQVETPEPEQEIDEDPFAGLDSDEQADDDEEAVPAAEADKTEDPEPAGKSDSPVAEDEPGGDPFGIEQDSESPGPEEEIPQPKEQEPAPAENPPAEDADEEIPEREYDPFSGLLQDASDKLSSEKEEETAAVPQFKAVPVRIKTTTSSKTEKPEKKKEIPVKPKEPKRNPVTLVIMVLLGFVLLAASYLAYLEFFQSSTPQASVFTAPESEETTVPDEPAIPAGEQQNPEAMQTMEPEEVSEVSDDEDSVSPETSPYGLMGRVSEAGNQGYSIVVYSYNREYQARDVAADLGEEGYRVLVTSRVVQGNTVWRVSLGQFPSIREALTQAAELPEPFNTEHFIQRIR